MTLTELLAEVTTVTNRPDLTARTLSAVRSATLKYHSKEFFRNDLMETSISFGSASYTQQIDVSNDTVLQRFRALRYIRLTDSAYNDGAKLEVISPENYKDEYGYIKSNVCYVAGSSIQMRSNTQFQYIVLGYYQRPKIGIVDADYSSWIAINHPYLIVHEAAAIVLVGTGRLEEAKTFKGLALEEWQSVLTSNPPDMIGN